jgi:plasmid stabilization system protein ParE
MLIVNWKQTAINDLESITTYIFDHNPIAALTLADEILQTAERLADMPYSGRLGRVDGTREKIYIQTI